MRTCPSCKCTESSELYGVTGLYVVCNNCGEILAHRRDADAAPIDLRSDEEVDGWVREGTFIRAPSDKPEEDEIYHV